MLSTGHQIGNLIHALSLEGIALQASNLETR